MMHRSFFITVPTLCMLLLVSTAYAASDTFRIRTLVGNDTTPPSTPTNLVATPVATSQIDLTWSTSTDNYILSGYQVFRDGTQIATTTSPSYSDAGLTASTTYTYYVTAFDSFNNVSASSTAVATTTLSPAPVTPTTTPTTTTTTAGSVSVIGGYEPVSTELLSLEVIPNTTSVAITWRTQSYVRSVLRWGRTSSYELGSLAEQTFKRTHETIVDGLTPGTRYYFTLEGENSVGMHGVMTASTWKTLPATDTQAPANVRGLTAQRDGGDIVLTWQNPSDPDFSRVRILRSPFFYPETSADGQFVYEGDGTSARDGGAAVPGSTQYYTVFSYDEQGNISSGAIVALTIGSGGATVLNPVTELPGTPTTSATGTEGLGLTAADVQFLQDDTVLPNTNGSVHIDGTKSLLISVPYDKLPEHLKTILVTVYQDEGRTKQFSFLLRVNTAQTAYRALVSPFGISGNFPYVVSVYDFRAQRSVHVSGDIVSSIAFQAHTPIGASVVQRDLMPAFLTLLVLLILLGLYLILRSRRTAS